MEVTNTGGHLGPIEQKAMEEKHETKKDSLEEKREKIIKWLKDGNKPLIYLGLLIIVWIGAFIRTRNLSGLKDITTNSWTLGPDLDPFLFLRYAKYIVENGSFIATDMFRYVPLGYPTTGETKLLPYLIAYLYKFLVGTNAIFGIKDLTVDFAGVIFPVVMFAFATVAFFFFVNEVFRDKKYSDLISLVATLFFVVSPVLLSRTIAGIPEKENSIGFMFAAFYFFLVGWRAKNLWSSVLFATLAGIMSGLMGLIWGGLLYLYLTIGMAALVSFILGKVSKRQMICYTVWLILLNAIIVSSFMPKYSLYFMLTNMPQMIMYLPVLLFVVSLAIEKISFLRKYSEKVSEKFPREVFVLVLTAAVGLFLLVFVIHGPADFVKDMTSIVDLFISPVTNRFGLTVAENRQPYFGEWRDSFGPNIRGIPIYFWLFVGGSVLLFYHAFRIFENKKRWILTGAFAFMIFGTIFSRYDPTKLLNGVNLESKLLYFGSVFLFCAVIARNYIIDYRARKHEFKKLDFSYIFIFSMFLVTLAAGRSAVRLIMILAIPAAILCSFLLVHTYFTYRNSNEKNKTMLLILTLAVLILSAYTLYYQYQASKGSAQGFMPSAYTQQWQKAMAWVRDNTQKDAVFAHWWDYGYWLQSIGDRATVLDGGNAIVYWDHLMGRHVLTGSSINNSLTFLYTHKATHLLIDSTDIGKYGAYASIGGDENNDRASFIPTLLKDDTKMFETKNETVFVYPSGFGLDEDMILEENSSKQIFSRESSAIAGVFLRVSKNSSKLLQPELVVVDTVKGSQTRIPMKYLNVNGTMIEFKSGIDAGIMVIPRIIPQGNSGISVDPNGAVLYFSKRTVHSMMARLFLFGEKDEEFELVHTESNMLIDNLRQQGLQIGDFAFYGDVMGPIKIWEIKYPEDIQSNPEWLKTEYPDIRLVY